MMPIHWATFNLAPHPWAEPGEWTKDAGEEVGQAVALPRPGEPFEPSKNPPVDPWWRAVSTPFERPWRRVERPEAPPVAEVPEASPVAEGDLDLAGDR
jgi:hypothetical protein